MEWLRHFALRSVQNLLRNDRVLPCVVLQRGGHVAIEEKNHLWRVVFEAKKFYS